MRHFLANVATYTISVLLIAGAGSLAVVIELGAEPRHVAASAVNAATRSPGARPESSGADRTTPPTSAPGTNGSE